MHESMSYCASLDLSLHSIRSDGLGWKYYIFWPFVRSKVSMGEHTVERRMMEILHDLESGHFIASKSVRTHKALSSFSSIEAPLDWLAAYLSILSWMPAYISQIMSISSMVSGYASTSPSPLLRAAYVV